ncbi:Gegh 16 protein [Pleurostoma richardsiae]|uniref:Gegh 16 protein n=1 Tax=Pleurostoma richardsiae TaxID=41990 RepID=A0AA38VLD1_9PEZI|nr:Gegh 16 protein [Pleurostoma richardsiae]
MFSHTSVLSFAALLSVAHAHGVILGAQGLSDSPASVGFQVDPNLARNCTTISPCQQDATIIRDAEITANIVNECGRTEISGNIDVGENTENALAAGQVTQVQAGTELTVTIHQVNADGAGPYVCDLDETSNSGIISQNLSVTNNVPGVNGLSQAKAQAFNITVKMPDTLSCTGASTGNVCTVRCRNNAVAGPFGGCFAVQQVDTTAKVNTPENIATLQSLDAVLNQVTQNQADLPVAIAANQAAGSSEAEQNLKAANSLLGLSVTTKASPVTTPVVNLGAASTVSASAAATTTASSNVSSKGSGRNRGKNSNANDKRDSTSGLRWAKRYVVAGKDFTDEES